MPSPRRRTHTNATIRSLLRCAAPELRRLKKAFRSECLAQHVNGSPLLGQVGGVVDPNGSLREEVWDRVAAADAVLESLLRGERWTSSGGALPRGFERRLRGVKAKIWDDLNGEARRRPQRSGKGRVVAVEGEESGDEDGDSSVIGDLTPGGWMAARQEDAQPRTPTRRSRALVSTDPTSSMARRPTSSLKTRAVAPSSLGRRSGSGLFLSDDSPETEAQAEAGADPSPPPQPTHFLSQSPAVRAASRLRRLNVPLGGLPAVQHRTMTLPTAIRRIRELESRVAVLEQEAQQCEERALERVQSMFKRRERLVERLRWYLEGEG